MSLPQEAWIGYGAKFNVKYVLPQYLIVSQRGPDGWNPDAGTGYPYSGQAGTNQYFWTERGGGQGGLSGAVLLRNDVSTYLNYDNAVASGSGPNVPSSVDTSPNVTYIYTFISGTVSPDQTSSWYQWTSGGIPRASVPNNQVAGVFASGINVSGNSVYAVPANENLANFQIQGKYQLSAQSGTTANSGVSNVPFSESSWNV